MKLHDLEVFCAVAEEESFVNAAHRLFVSQSAVTQHIKKIETELGFPLLIRNKHFVKITAQGKIFHRAAKDILLRYRQALDDCARESGAEHILRLSYVGPSGAPYLTDTLKQFHILYPECEIVTRRLRPDQVNSTLEQDETNLLQAYELFCKVTEICETTAKENSTARLRSLEITSPLCKRDDYTLGDSMAFLTLWFLQKNPDATVVPEFTRGENGLFYIDFTDRELWSPNSLEKEVLRILI